LVTIRVAVLHPSFRVFGGAEHYSIHIIKLLAELGFNIDVYMVDRTHQPRLLGSKNKINFYQVKPVPIIEFSKLRSIYDLLAYAYTYSRMLQERGKTYDLVVNAKTNEIPVGADICVVHYPLGYVLYHWDRFILGAGVDPKYTKGFWKLYIQPFRVFFHRISERGLRNCRVVVANSIWTAEILKTFLGDGRVTVIYPPIDPSELRVGVDVDKKERLVVTISRFDPSKRLELVLYVAKHIPEARFVIIGRVDDKSYGYYRYIAELRERLKAVNVAILPNLSEDGKREILARARVYFHPTIGEHFGISVLEAVIFGAVPVVHELSGACTDIVRSLGVGYCYRGISEAIEMIRDLLEEGYDSKTLNEIREKIKMEFSFNAFRTRWLEAISRVMRP